MLKFNDSCNVNCVITLSTGREIVLDTFYQQRTYAGLMAGTPSASTNQWSIEQTLEKACSLSKSSAKPLLIAPERRDFHRVIGDMNQIRGNVDGDRITEWLPEVSSIGTFHSLMPALGKRGDFSLLTIVWYQPEFGLPDASFIQSQLATVDWDTHAESLDW